MPNQHNSQYKYVVAHEFGHVIASGNFGTAFWYDGSDNTQPNTPNSQPLCRCDAVVEGNQKHCLQSKEYESYAINEGFAHFIAARTFNDPVQADCSFAYYKSFLVPGGGFPFPNDPKPLPPPHKVSCTGLVQWIDNHCPAPPSVFDEQGNEWDWMTFFYDEINQPVTVAFTLQELYQSFRLACTGDNNQMCNGHNLIFNHTPVSVRGVLPNQPLTQAACAVAGSGSCTTSNPRYVAFVNEGRDHGVDH